MPKRVAALLLALLLMCPLSCSDGSRHVVTVRFWNGFTGPDGRTMLHMVQRFNQQNPDVHVLMQRMDWSTYYKKLFVAGMGGRAPELFVIPTHALTRFATAGFARPIDDLVAGPVGVDIADIDPNVWAAVERGGKHYGLPLDVHPLGMYYNRRLFREAGIVDAHGEPAVPTDAASFIDAARRMTKRRTGERSDEWGFVFTNLQSNVYCVMQQFGGSAFNGDYSRCTLNDPRNVAALQFCVDLIHKQRIAPDPQNIDAWIGFRQGRVGMAFEGIYMLADLSKQKDLDFSGAPAPQFGVQNAVWAGSHNLCVRSGLGEAELRGAWRFAKYLSDNSLDWAAGGQVPVRQSLRNTDRFRSMTVQAQFAKQIPYVRYIPSVNFVFEFQTELDTAVEAALRGSQSPQQALESATANMNRIIARDRQMQSEARRLNGR